MTDPPPARLNPPRVPRSIRRTTNLDVLWPEGTAGHLRFEGIGRDLRTRSGGDSEVADYVELSVEVDPAERRIVAVDSSQDDGSSGMVGRRIGREVREAMAERMPSALQTGSLVTQLLDDLTGAWVVAGIALRTWDVTALNPPLRTLDGARRQMVGVCRGFAEGSSGLAPDGGYADTFTTEDLPPLTGAEDPLAWHELPNRTEMSMRRVRRIDVRSGLELEIDSMFQDSSTAPDGLRKGIHQYALVARADRNSLVLTALSATPEVLPYRECPTAALGLSALLGLSLNDLRERVLIDLAGTRGCTHLNDAVRALAPAAGLAGRAGTDG